MMMKLNIKNQSLLDFGGFGQLYFDGINVDDHPKLDTAIAQSPHLLQC
jgi:hypothetical protein